MKIVWDELKRKENIDKRGLDAAKIDIDFFDRCRIVPAKLGRFSAFGMFEGRPVVVIFKRLGTEGVSIVTMRIARVSERKAYDLFR